MTILDDIVEYKKNEVGAAKKTLPLSALDDIASTRSPIRPFQRALENAAQNRFALIAEIKKASPSKGLIRSDFLPAQHARDYEAGGAACLSVLTDKPSFQGDPAFLIDARNACALPVLRKDFMIDPYQVSEANAWGADCILLIMACLSDQQAAELFSCANEVDLGSIFEVHDEEELARATELGASMIGINNRNLKTFETDLATTPRLASNAPKDALIIAESGIGITEDLDYLAKSGANAFLVGESLMRQADVEIATKELLGTA